MQRGVWGFPLRNRLKAPHRVLADVRFWGQSGKHLLLLSISPLDPLRTLDPINRCRFRPFSTRDPFAKC
jgi:hypothetical protein